MFSMADPSAHARTHAPPPAHTHTQLPAHGPITLADVRRAYKALAVALHPDKCSEEGAQAAFQRVNTAHTNLVKQMV